MLVRDSVAAQARRHGAVEDVEAEGDAAEQVVDLADPEQVLGRPLGQEGRGEGEDRGLVSGGANDLHATNLQQLRRRELQQPLLVLRDPFCAREKPQPSSSQSP